MRTRRSPARALGILVLVVSVLAAGCSDGGGGSASPVAPTPPRPNYQGTWSGNYSITSCQATGNFSGAGGFCSTFSPGRVFPVRLVVAVSPSDNATGTLELGGIPVNVTGVVGGNGHLLLSGGGNSVGFNVVVTGWDTTASGTTMSGGWTTTWTSPTIPGSAITVQTITTVTKVG